MEGAEAAVRAARPICSSAPLIACPANQVCDYDTANRCGAGSLTGHCIVQPQACLTDYNPVCGCDGKTYGNNCSRQGARIQLDHIGACGGTGGGAGGTGGSATVNCAPNLTCDGTQSYCYRYYPGTSVSPPVFLCKDIPTACGSTPTCACICPTSTDCKGCTCAEGNGLVSLTCAGA